MQTKRNILLVPHIAIIITIGILIGMRLTAYAAPASPDPEYFTQPDGTVVRVSVKGDEFLGWIEDADGSLIIFDLENNGYCHAVWTDDGPVSTGELVSPPDPDMSFAPGTGGARSRVKGRDVPERYRERAKRERESEMDVLMSAGIVPLELNMTSGSAPTRVNVSSLKRNLLIIHATWTDRTGINTPKLNGSQIYNIAFSPNDNSVNKYYKELFNAAEDIILPAAVSKPLNDSPGIIEVTLSGRHTNPGNGSTGRKEIMTSALAAASASGQINFAAFDTNKNGTLETTELSIGVIIDGYESSVSGLPAPSFWGSAGSAFSPDKSLTNNVKIQSAFGQGAFHRTTGKTVNDMLTIGIICHELGHSAYSFVDTYDTQSNNVNDGESQGHGYWSLMADGSWSRKHGEFIGTSPSYVDAYNLVMHRLVSPGEVSVSGSDITINSHLDIYQVNSGASDSQYFLLQQRKYGSADNYDRGAFNSVSSASDSGTGGLLIYHIDENVPERGVNDKNTHYGAAIAEAHGGRQNLRTVHNTTGSNSGDLNDLWGGDYKLFSGTSDPSSRLYSAYTNDAKPPVQETDSGVEIRNITWNKGVENTGFRVLFRDSGCCFVDDFGSLQAAINKYKTATDDMVITVSADFNIAAGLTIPGNANGAALTITSADAANPVTLTSGYYFVNSGVKLILENIVMDGNKGDSPLVSVDGGEFIMKDGAVLKNNGGGMFSDGAVVVSDGVFTMSGGEISGNTAFAGGGVYMYGGEFIMTGGRIINNTALFGGGVYIDNTVDAFGSGDYIDGGKFTMLGGEISGNTASWGYGGGVYAGDDFTMLGGKITGNTAEYGGGVLVDYWREDDGTVNGEFNLGGTAVISGNTSNNVYLSDSRYITLSTDTPPVSGMNVGVMTETADGVIVESGAKPGDETYFFTDVSDGEVRYKNGQLIINEMNFSGSGSIEITTPPAKTVYTVGETLDLMGMIVTLTYLDGRTAIVTGYASNPADGAILSAIGKQPVTVVYEDAIAFFTVTVNDTPGAGGGYAYEMDGVSYSSFSNMLKNIPDGTPVAIKLLEDVGSDLVIRGKIITFELDGHDLTGGMLATSGSMVTLTGDVSGVIVARGKGTIVNVRGDARGGVSAYEGGTVNVKGDVYNGATASAGGTVTIDGALKVKNYDNYVMIDERWLGKREGIQSTIKPGYIEYTFAGASSVVWVKAPAFTYGDVSGDGYANLADVMALARSLAGWKGAVVNNAEAADVDDDGFVTLRDLLVLRRYFANWKGYETLPLWP